ncbi:MAG: hypothetical protein IPM02_27685 [Betaproteobacteria bacterium]|nr:hypothetical protein [Betaproteobacteria bacterium]
MTNGKQPVEEMVKTLNAPGIKYTLVPRNVVPFIDFTYRAGAIKVKPDSWKDLFFPGRARLARQLNAAMRAADYDRQSAGLKAGPAPRRQP